MSERPPSKQQQQQKPSSAEEEEEPIISIENVDFVANDQQQGSHRRRRASSFSNPDEPNAHSSNSNNNYYYPEAQVTGAGTPPQGYGATAYYGGYQQQQQAQQPYYTQQHQQPPPPPPSQYYNMQQYQQYAQAQQAQAQAQAQAWQGMPQVYTAPPGYGYHQHPQQASYDSNLQQQHLLHRRARSSNSPVPSHARQKSEPIHPLKETKDNKFAKSLWSDVPAEHETLLQDNSSGYGAISGATASRNRPKSPREYSQPVESGAPVVFDSWEKAAAASLSKARDRKVNADGSTSARTSPSSAVQQRKSHRRASSDSPLGPVRPEKARSKTASRLPTDPQRLRKSFQAHNNPATANRQRSLSASQTDAANRQRGLTASQLAPLGGQMRPTHRRSASINSVATDASRVSIVSDIRKSSFYGGVHESSGEVQMHYPFENVHLAIVDDKNKKNLGMHQGHLYKSTVDQQVYEEYHRAAEEVEMDMHWNLDNPLACNCTCNNCNGCTGKKELLPANFYAMAVDQDIYRHVVDEIADSRSMPCGLFFCGHHEDVSHPSILIAVAIVLLMFLGMGAIAYEMRV